MGNRMDPMPTEAQRERLVYLLGDVIVGIRPLCWQGTATQAADLADAVHNLPREMHNRDGWSVSFARDFLVAFEEKYDRTFRYVANFDRIFERLADGR